MTSFGRRLFGRAWLEHNVTFASRSVAVDNCNLHAGCLASYELSACHSIAIGTGRVMDVSFQFYQELLQYYMF
eukprot:288760-Amphidinium_carterae.1